MGWRNLSCYGSVGRKWSSDRGFMLVTSRQWLPAHQLDWIHMVVKGVIFSLQWQAKVLHLKTDSLCIYHCLRNSLSGKTKVQMKAATEMLVRRRLQTLSQLIKEYGQTNGNQTWLIKWNTVSSMQWSYWYCCMDALLGH